jgi:hypothetical protein
MNPSRVSLLSALLILTGSAALEPVAAQANPTGTQNAATQAPARKDPAQQREPAADDRPPSVSRDTYQGSQGKKKDPGTACSTARLKPDGTLDCGTSGKTATPK